MTNKSYKKYFYVFAATAGMLAVSQILDAETASNTVEIMAKTASNASDTALASGSAVLDQLLGGQGTYWLATLGGGGIAGWCVGYTLKKVAKVVAIFLGITFITLQYLAYKHVITVDWTKVQFTFCRFIFSRFLARFQKRLMGLISDEYGRSEKI